MKWWPWAKRAPERRGYTDAITSAFVAAAQGGADAAPLATAALEAASGLYARCMAAAVVTGAPDAMRALTPSVLAHMGRELLRRGQSLWRIRIAGGRVVLDPVAYATLHGRGPDASRWLYDCNLYGPTDSERAYLAASSVLHVRYGVDSARPWEGVPPWSWASSTGAAVAALERLVAREAAAPHGSLLGVPESPQVDEAGDVKPLDAFRADLAKARGGTLVMEHSGQWDTETPGGAGRSKLEHLRYGMMRETVDPLRTATGRDVLAACGVPPSLFVATSDGTAQREAFRRFLHTALRPMARVMEAELRAKLDAPALTLDMSEVGAADVAGRARAFKAFVESGMDPEDAARETGVTLTRPLRAPAPDEVIEVEREDD